FALVGTLLGEWSRWHLTPRGAGAMAYLVVFGSILGYSAYTYALRHASPTIVGTYAYVNPVIAVLLGWLILAEPVTARTFLAMALILGAVVWIQCSHKSGRSGGRDGGRAVLRDERPGAAHLARPGGAGGGGGIRARAPRRRAPARRGRGDARDAAPGEVPPEHGQRPQWAHGQRARPDLSAG